MTPPPFTPASHTLSLHSHWTTYQPIRTRLLPLPTTLKRFSVFLFQTFHLFNQFFFVNRSFLSPFNQTLTTPITTPQNTTTGITTKTPPQQPPLQHSNDESKAAIEALQKELSKKNHSLEFLNDHVSKLTHELHIKTKYYCILFILSYITFSFIYINFIMIIFLYIILFVILLLTALYNFFSIFSNN